MVLVVGATGLLGSEICRRLVAAGQPVCGLVRATSAPDKVTRLQALGVRTVTGDLRDPVSLAAACRGVEAVVTTATTTVSRQPGDSIPVTDQAGQLHLVEAALAAGVGQFVYVSYSLGFGDSPLTTAKRTLEKAVKASGMAYTILQPAYFMEVWLSPALGFDYPQAKVTVYGEGHARSGYISVGDVAECVVASLSQPAARNAVIELVYPQSHSLLEVVRIFEQINQKSFELQFVPVAALEAQRAASTDPLSISFASLMLDLANGLQVNPASALANYGSPMVSVEAYARRVLGRE